MDTNPYLYLTIPDGVVVFPHPDDPTDVEWALRNGNPTKSDLLVAASYIGAYRQMVNDSAQARDRKVAAIRAGAAG